MHAVLHVLFKKYIYIIYLWILEMSCEMCYRLNMSSDLISLHIGDRILEINGTPVKDQPIESIENLIQHSDTVLQVNFILQRQFTSLLSAQKIVNNKNKMHWTLQLTIEHDPDAVSRRPAYSSPTAAMLTSIASPRTSPENKERLFKRRDEGYISGTRSRQLRRTRDPMHKERSSSMSRLLDGYRSSFKWNAFIMSTDAWIYIYFKVCPVIYL